MIEAIRSGFAAMVPPHEIARLDHEELLREEFNRWPCEGRSDEMEHWHRPVTEKVVGRMQLSPDERILDLGCGDGWTCRLLSPLAPEGAVVGIDIADEMIAIARGRSIELDNILFAPGSAEEIPWAEDYFTRVLSVESAYYWHSPEKAAGEIFRVTAWGGRIFVLMFYHRENPYTHHWQEHVPLVFSSSQPLSGGKPSSRLGSRMLQRKKFRMTPLSRRTSSPMLIGAPERRRRRFSRQAPCSSPERNRRFPGRGRWPGSRIR